MSTYKISKSIRREIAEAMVKQSAPDYDSRYFGQYFAVDTDGDNTLDTVYHKEETAPWNPWHDNAVAFPVADLYDGSASFDPTPDQEEPEDLNEDEWAEIFFKEAVDFAERELPSKYEA